MKRIQNNVLVAIALLLGTFQVEAQEHSLTDEERQAKLDSIIAETERHFGWNDDTYSVKTAKEMWLSGDAKLLLQGGIAPLAYVGQEKFAKNIASITMISVVSQIVRTLKWLNIIPPL